MNLLNFIPYLKNPERIEEFVLQQNATLDIDYADIYLEDKLDIYSNMRFFNAEEIEGKIEMKHEGKSYINLFPLDYLQEIFDDFNNGKLSDLEIADKIMSYRIKDA